MTDFIVVEVPGSDSLRVEMPEVAQITSPTSPTVVGVSELTAVIESTPEGIAEIRIHNVDLNVLEPQVVLRQVTVVTAPAPVFNATLSDISPSVCYYGGLSAGGWKINRWVGVSKTSASESNNPSISSLNSAWSFRYSLNYV